MTPPFIRITCATSSGEVSAKIGVIGAGIQEMQFGDRDIIPAAPDIAQTKWFAAVALAPWPNRLRDGVWTHDGRELQGEINDSLGHALHGLVFDKEFTVEQSSTSEVSLSYVLGADDVYPFTVRVSFSYRVDATGLSCAMNAENLGTVSAPIGLGVHPYFPYDDSSTITFSGTEFFEVDERLIPTGPKRPVAKMGITPGVPTSLASLAVDDCFTSAVRDIDGRAHTLIAYADGWETDVWQDEHLPHTVIFTKRDFPWADSSRHGIAIEPQTCPTNALQTGKDLVWLDPAAEFAGHWGITVRMNTK